MKTLDDWQQAFNERLKTKTFEQFSLLLFDVDTADPKQSKLLQKILFTDHTSVVYWGDYIEYVFSIFPNRKLQLQRLLNKALEFVDEKVNRNHRHLTMLHLKSAELKR